ncbi:hypothetical protein FHS29_006249 [Saccharothrix tamanrassetensis]|uniref:Reverse transcriptase domain-containing protein n=1 Tax=Saccharothrix tamanrassetensis TaxID=1051531 RepID=A0A841CU12_9PSEU|nr:reverse transcriptase domain-containing protein [Saccharothrix tamanrassetensis]MBB5959628.1 hypothetical protein [Saccharothrix tamanrassetensis]
MGAVDWLRALDIEKATANVRHEFTGDWHRDPWGWPELGFLLGKKQDLFVENCKAVRSRQVSLIDVPKENWGSRPAVVLDPLDRITYQALIDRLSVDLIGKLSPSSFGWRLHAVEPKNGVFSRNKTQWNLYRAHLSSLAGVYPVALKTDIVSCFASIPVQMLADQIEEQSSSGAVSKRLVSMLEGFSEIPDRSGIPQRSTASSALANMFLSALDDVLHVYAKPLPRVISSKVRYESFARWMDDIWLFVKDPGIARQAQIDLQQVAQTLGLNLNSAKTDVLEGSDVAKEAREVEHSAVDGALFVGKSKPLEELIENVLDSPEKASRTALKFMSKRMRDHRINYRVQDLLSSANRMPHGADVLAPLFKENFHAGDLQDWYLEYVNSPWAAFQWSIAQYGRMFSSGRKPQKRTRDFFARMASDANSSLPQLALSCQRLSAWDPIELRAIARSSMRNISTPHSVRVMALAALGAGEKRATIRKWLGQIQENDATLKMLEVTDFRALKVIASYAD